MLKFLKLKFYLLIRVIADFRLPVTAIKLTTKNREKNRMK